MNARIRVTAEAAIPGEAEVCALIARCAEQVLEQEGTAFPANTSARESPAVLPSCPISRIALMPGRELISPISITPPIFNTRINLE